MVKTPTYHVFEMYNVHQGARLVPLTLESESYEYQGESIPAITASASEKDGMLNITMTNSNPNKPIPFRCNVGRDYSSVRAKVLRGNEISDYNDFGQEEKVYIEDYIIEKGNSKMLSFDIPAHAVILIQLQL